MSHHPPPDEPPFGGFETPAPPEELRGQGLALAREALVRETPRDVWTRIWESRPLRIAWAAAATLLVAANLVVGTRRPPAPAVSRSGAAAEREAARELSAFVALPPIDETVKPLVGRAAADAASPERRPANPGGGLS